MFMRFFTELRQAKVPVTLKEYLMLMEGLDKAVINRSVDDFYYLSRAALVKDEKNLDRFDQVFGHVFKGLERLEGDLAADIPAEWLKKMSEKFLTEEEKAQIEAMGGFDKLKEALAERIKRQIRVNTTPRHVPARIVQVADIPRTKSGKIVELAIRQVVHGEAVRNTGALANPEALEQYRGRAELVS